MNSLLKKTAIIVGLVTLFSCQSKKEEIATLNDLKNTSLKEVFKTNFLMGTALSNQQLNSVQDSSVALQLVKKQFNAITPENDLKWEEIHPAKDTFNFATADKYVQFGIANKMHVVGHTLVWHSQLPAWVKQLENKEDLKFQMEHHIKTIVGRYKDKINAWDVVNEALNEDGTLRNSVFLKLLGDNYIAQAFKLAATADPKAQLVYNDYNLCDTEKRGGAVRLVKSIQEQGVKIDAVGIQAHWKLESPSLKEIEKSILDFAALNVKVLFTELDVTVLPNPWDLVGADVNQNFEGDEKMNPYPKELPKAIKIKLAKRYKDIFELFLKHQDKIGRVTFWGVNDGQTWLNDWPILGRSNYPLLFDRNYEPKQAFDSILSLH